MSVVLFQHLWPGPVFQDDSVLWLPHHGWLWRPHLPCRHWGDRHNNGNGALLPSICLSTWPAASKDSPIFSHSPIQATSGLGASQQRFCDNLPTRPLRSYGGYDSRISVHVPAGHFFLATSTPVSCREHCSLLHIESADFSRLIKGSIREFSLCIYFWVGEKIILFSWCGVAIFQELLLADYPQAQRLGITVWGV